MSNAKELARQAAIARPRKPPQEPKELLWTRNMMSNAMVLLCEVIDDPATSEDRRGRAQEVFDDLGFEYCYSDARSYAGERTIRMMPVLMSWPGAYDQLTEEFLLDLPEEVKADKPIQVMLARQSAKMVDTHAFGRDFRLECLAALNEVLASLRNAAAELADAELDAELEELTK